MFLAMRLVVVNVFLWGLFSYPNKHFLMPLPIVRHVQDLALRFLTRVTWVELGFLSHIGSLYGLRTQLRDLRLTNVASLRTSYKKQPEALHLVRSSLATAAEAELTGSTMHALLQDRMHPAHHVLLAYDLFRLISSSFLGGTRNAPENK